MSGPVPWRLNVNGHPAQALVDPTVTLQGALHHVLGLRDVRRGCGEGVCGACAVLLDGEPVASCLLLALQASGRDVVTASGLPVARAAASPESGARFERLRSHLVGAQAFQCGYCACGMLVSADHHLQSGGRAAPAVVRAAISGHLCRCTGYASIVEAVAAAGSGEAAAPSGVARPDLVEKLGGTARYPSDRHLPDALVGRILWSEHPAARIARIDVDEARAVDGVEAVLTWRDVPGRNLAPGTLFARDQPLLARDRVRTMGDAVALVAARSDAIARRALARIRVEYVPEAPVAGLSAALRRDAPRVNGRANVAGQLAEAAGDVEAAFRIADTVVAGTYTCEMTDHSPIELEGGTGWMEGDEICLSVPCQTPFTVKRGVARVLGISERRVRPVAHLLGGAFGRYLMPSVEGYLALLVHSTRRPVRLVLERPEVIGRRAKRHRLVATYHLAVREDGTLLGLKAELLTDAGPYQSLTPPVISVFASEAGGAYRLPAYLTVVKAVMTNGLVAAPARGFGSQQVNFGIDSLIEKAARTMELDPMVIRRKNLRPRVGGHGGSPADAGLTAVLDLLAERLGPTPAAPDGWLTGRGLSCIAAKYGYPYGMVDRAVARLTVDAEGAFTVEADLTDAGTGVTAGLASLAAQALGLHSEPGYELCQAAIADPTGTLLTTGRHPSWLRAGVYRGLEGLQLFGSLPLIFASSRLRPATLHTLMRLLARPINLLAVALASLKSWLYPFGIDSFSPRTSGSRGLYMTGRAVLDAARRLRDGALALAASRFGVAAGEVSVGDAGAWVTAKPELTLSWAELAGAAGGALSAAGRASLPRGSLLDPATGNQAGVVDFQPAAHCCDLAVHPRTGEVRILRYVAVHDVGRALNLDAIRGQVAGGVAMGVGQVLYERLPANGGGGASRGFREYLLPTSLDVPDRIEVEIVELGDGLGPHGAKGVGEAAAVAAPSAIANALYDATGRQPTSIPITPEQIVQLASGGE